MKPDNKRQSAAHSYASQSLPVMGQYEPHHFLCCHSVVEGDKRKQTKVWACAFEPRLHQTGETGKILATCGGNTVCFIDTLTGLVMKRFKDTDKAEDFYTLAWTSLEDSDKKMNVLAVAGRSCTIKMICPDQLVCYCVIKGHHKYISCLMFHPHHPSLLFSGSMDGSIMLWNVGKPSDQGTVNHSPLMKLKTSATVGDALCLTFSSKRHALVDVTEKGFVGWAVGKITPPSSSHRTKIVEQYSCSFVVPPSGTSEETALKTKSHGQVDSLIALQNGLVATKCVGAADILVWSLDDSLASRGSKKQVVVKPLLRLVYPEVAEKYINMGYVNGVLSVGNDRGTIYLYDLKELVEKIPAAGVSALLMPSQVLEWPEVDDMDDRETKMEVSDRGDGSEDEDDETQVVINMVVVSSDGAVVAGGTDNNLVCIWRRTHN